MGVKIVPIRQPQLGHPTCLWYQAIHTLHSLGQIHPQLVMNHLVFFARVKFPNVIALPNGLSKSRLPLKSNGLSEKNIVLHIKIAIELKVNPPVLDTENLSHTQGQDP